MIEPLQPIIRKEETRMNPDEITRFSSSLNKVVIKHKVNVIVVGLPVHEDKLTPLCKEIIELMKQTKLSCAHGAPICTFQDESFSTEGASRMFGMQRKTKAKFAKEKDGVSAVIILKDFFRERTIAFNDSIVE
jgi:RNase H-fold protein (predicted Holliday junction resolvase)